MPNPKSLRILLILIEPPLPFGNAGSRWFHVLFQELKKRGHQVQVLVASGVPKDVEKARLVFKNESPPMAIFPFGEKTGYLQKMKSFFCPHRSKFSPDFERKLLEVDPDTFDIVHVEQTWGGWVTLPWAKKTLLNIHYLQSIDLQQAKPRSWKEKLLFRQYFRTEWKLISQYPHIRTCTPRLEKAVRNKGDKKNLATVPFGIDLSLYPFIPTEKRQTEKPLVTLIGNMGWYPSVSAARRLLDRIWPAIHKQVPQARLQIVGWQARTALRDFLETPGIEILENVPEIQPYFENASVLVYPPMRGSGMKIKVQEALAFGVPVVTTWEGAEGLPAKDMEHMGLSDSDEGLTQRAVEILCSPKLQEQLRRQGRALVESHCDPKKNGQWYRRPL